MKRFPVFVFFLIILSASAHGQANPLAPAYLPAIDCTPGDYPANIWMTDSLVKVRQDAGSPTTVKCGTFYGTQNEFVDFQVHFHDTGAGTANLSVTASNFVQATPTAFTISAASTDVIVYREAYMNVTQKTATGVTYYNATGKYPDPLIPTVDPYHGQTTNAFPFNVAANNNQSAWIDVHIPAGAPSGYYLGSVTVKSGSTVLATMPVILAVWQWPSAGSMPSTSSLHFQTRQYYDDFCKQVYGSAGACSAYPGAGGSAQTAATLISVDLGRNLLDHRIGAANYFDPQYSNSFAGLESNYGPLLNGTSNTILPGAKLTAVEYNAPDFSSLQAWATEFNSHGWFSALIDNSCDEPPSCPGGWSGIPTTAASLHAVTPPIPGAVTTNIAAANTNGVTNSIDIFVPKINDLDPQGGSLQRSAYNTWLGGSSGPTRQIWEYQSCSSAGTCTNGSTGPSTATWPNYDADGTPPANRVFGWLHWRNNVSGELYYAVTDCFSDPVCTGNNPWNSIYAYGGWGDGTLVYPGDSGHVGGGVTTPIWIQSVRLKHIRDGLQDYEYLKRLTAAGQGTLVTNQINSWISNSYTFNVSPTALQTARQNLGAAMHALSFPATGTGLFITQSGGGTGTSCASPQSAAFFNNASNWGTGSGQIGPGTTVNLCGTFTGTQGAIGLTVQGNGAAGNPVTIAFQPGAVMTSPAWGAAILISGHNFITVDGLTNGTIENTLAGSSGATCLAGPCTVHDPTCSGASPSFDGGNCTFVNFYGNTIEVRNIRGVNVYIHTGTGSDGGQSKGIFNAAGTSSNISVHDNTVNDAQACIFASYLNLSNANIFRNSCSNQVWGVGLLDSDGGSSATQISVHDNNIAGFQNWQGPNGGDNGFHQDGIIFSSFNTGATFTHSQIYNNNINGAMTNPSTAHIYLSGGSGGMNTIDAFNNQMYAPPNSVGHTPTNDMEALIVVGFSAQGGIFANNTGVSTNPCIDIRETGSTVTTFENSICTGISASQTMFTAVLNKNGGDLTGKLKNNMYFNLRAGTGWVNGDGVTNYSTLAAWQAACACDANSFVNDPNLNPTTLIPNAGSLAIGAALNLSSLGITPLDSDRLGNARGGGNWTVGANNASGNTPQLSFSPSPLPFGNQTQGVTSAPQTLTITNIGTATEIFSNPISSISGTNGPDFVNTMAGTCQPGGSLAVNASCTVQLTFTPATQAGESAVLGITGTASGTVNLTGTGTAPATATVNITPNPIAFGNQVQSTPSPAMTVTIKNTGTANLVFATPFFSITGTNAADFARSGGGCANAGTVTPGNSCTLTIVFTPGSTGARNATLNIAGNASGTATLTGNGTVGPPALTISPSPVPFPNQTLSTTSAPITVTLHNGGTGPQIFSSPNFTISGTNGADFVNTMAGTCQPGGMLAAGGNCTMLITFTPSTVGAPGESAVLAVNGTATANVTLTGTGTAPATAAVNITPNPVPFGNQVQSMPSGAITVTVKNTGNANLVFSTPFFSIGGNNPGDFARSGGTCGNAGTVTPGNSCTVLIVFTPGALGPRAATLNIAGNASGSVPLTGTGVIPQTPGVSISPITFDFGNQLRHTTSSEETFTVTSTGNAPLVLATPFATVTGGTNPADFAITADSTCHDAQSLTNAQTCTVTVTFTPSTSGAESATLNINGNATTFATLAGTGTFPVISITPNPVNFGNIVQGVPSGTFTATVKNTGTATLTFGAPFFTITGTNPGDFSKTGGGCADNGTLAVNGTCTATFVFTPSATGTRTATLTIVGTNTTGTATLTGNGLPLAPAVTISPRPVNFPGTTQGSPSAAITVTIANSGGSNLVFGTPFFTITGTNAADFTRTGGGCANAGTVTPGTNCTIQIVFTPSTSGLPGETAQLNIAGNATGFVALAGQGVPVNPPPAPAPAVLLSFTLPAGTLRCTSILFGRCPAIPLTANGKNFLGTTKITLDGAALSSACTSVTCTAAIPSPTVSLPGFSTKAHTISIQ